MSSEENSNDTILDKETRYRARVKWFNNRAGYGFATIQSHDRLGEDVFVHHSGVTVTSEQYKYLVQGEYVEFNLRDSNNDKHPYQADNIRGVDGGMLMCETHAEVRKQRDKEGGGNRERRQESGANYSSNSSGGGGSGGDRYRLHGSGPRDGEHWYLVKGQGNNRNRRVRRQQRVYKDNSDNHDDGDNLNEQ